MTISMRLNEQDAALMKQYAEFSGLTVSEMIRRTVLEKIEEEYDLQAYQKAWAAYQADPQTLTLNEVEQELGLS